MAQKLIKKAAVVQCCGCRTEGQRSTERGGGCREVLENCKETSGCRFGCVGMGSCAEVCRLKAIFINRFGTAQIDFEKCVGCGLCVKACPQGLIRLIPRANPIYAACVNAEPGAQTRKECRSGCIACGICAKNCPVGAINIVENHAVIDLEKCIACGMCAVKCPRGAIGDAAGVFAAKL